MEEKNGKICVYACFGGFSNTGIVTALASMEAIKEVGLDRACIGCLAAIPHGAKGVKEKNDAAGKIVTIDGCPMECAKKIVEKAGYEPVSIVLTRDIGMTKKSLYGETDGKSLSAFINEGDVEKAKEVLVTRIQQLHG